MTALLAGVDSKCNKAGKTFSGNTDQLFEGRTTTSKCMQLTVNGKRFSSNFSLKSFGLLCLDFDIQIKSYNRQIIHIVKKYACKKGLETVF